MPDRSGGRTSLVRLLYGAIALFTFLGLGIVIWLVDKALRYPGIHARQFGRFGPDVPLWIPMALFVAVFVGGIVYVLWRAVRRVRAGEDLFRQRHRRRPDRRHVEDSRD